jgi:hypothetical protein
MILSLIPLSPELSSSLDMGTVYIDFNSKDPNPVVISAECFNSML